MRHLGTKQIETERLLLRRFELSDAEAMFNNYASDPKVTKFMTWLPHENIEESRKLISEWLPNYEKDDYYFWTIVLKSFGEPIGGISSTWHNDLARLFEIGYSIGFRWWHQGITSEALSALIDFFFIEVGSKQD